jgi:tRNA-Thr(GGU) m(6)t(6)A37 methyltransferase TsaA
MEREHTGLSYSAQPIGRVRSRLKQRSEAPKQGYEGAPEAHLEIFPQFRAGLDGIRAGHELIVLTWLHEAERDVLRVHPRDDAANPLTGVFATRSADRPNPIGLHRVRVMQVSSDGVVLVSGLEAIDGTPVIDIKPVLGRANSE